MLASPSVRALMGETKLPVFAAAIVGGGGVSSFLSLVIIIALENTQGFVQALDGFGGIVHSAGNCFVEIVDFEDFGFGVAGGGFGVHGWLLVSNLAYIVADNRYIVKGEMHTIIELAYNVC